MWLTQAQIVALFQKAKSTISFHISNILKEGELDEKVVVRKNRTTTMHGAINGKIQTHEVAFYNRNMKKIMIMDKYRLATILVAVLIAGSTAKAQTTTIGGSVYGGGALADTGDTHVNLIGGTINGDVYGGGKGDATTEAKVGSTFVNLNGIAASDYKTEYAGWGLVLAADTAYTVEKSAKGCVVGGSIFGCNNLNGTPKGSATVHIYMTNGDSRTASEDLESIDDTKHRYHLNAVYGGGNLAAYIPTAPDAKANVIIDGCDMTSIRTVYGGGNAASTPATSVVVNGTYEIEELFGGGNGLDALPDGRPNPGANVGYKNYTVYEEVEGAVVAKDAADADTKEHRGENYAYGSGAANVTVYGGIIHRVFGGSNTKGNVRISAVTLLDDSNDCDFNIDEAYGGGKSAPMDAEAQLMMACIPGLNYAYGGAEAADIQGDVTLNITNGTFNRVFGGNNKSGTIGGSITVNIEETGCKPIIIGELYGGGNLAPYDGHGQAGPTVNVRSFTSIGDIYGGGYGETAVVKGNTTVNVNVCEGQHKNTVIGENATTETIRRDNPEAEGGYPVPSHAEGGIGAINNVYGGGNAAQVIGDTHVNIGTEISETYATGDKASHDVKGADIRGNVYGGGNKAEVTGNTNVVVGKSSE